MYYAANNDGFVDAANARAIAVGGNNAISLDVLKEINSLQDAVITAAVAGNLEADVTTSAMAADTNYYNSWANYTTYNTGADKVRRARMDQVLAYFIGRGYNIRRVRVGTTDFFSWKIEW